MMMTKAERARRKALITVLAEMPDESFGWFVAWALGGFPDGLGGFTPESRTAIEALRRAAEAYVPASES